jgi:hypothetical protein
MQEPLCVSAIHSRMQHPFSHINEYFKSIRKKSTREKCVQRTANKMMTDLPFLQNLTMRN